MTEKNLYERMENLCKSKGIDGKIYEKGEIIYQPGDIDDSLYLIKNGVVRLDYLDESGRRLNLFLLGEGKLFGEMVLVGQRRRELLAQAHQDARIYEI